MGISRLASMFSTTRRLPPRMGWVPAVSCGVFAVRACVQWRFFRRHGVPRSQCNRSRFRAAQILSRPGLITDRMFEGAGKPGFFRSTALYIAQRKAYA